MRMIGRSRGFEGGVCDDVGGVVASGVRSALSAAAVVSGVASPDVISGVV
jgi:hypothetical protein